MSTPQDSGLCTGHKSMTTEIAFGGRNGEKKVGDVRGRAAAGDLLLINEPLDVLDTCSCGISQSAKEAAPGQCCLTDAAAAAVVIRAGQTIPGEELIKELKAVKMALLSLHSPLALELNTKRRHSLVLPLTHKQEPSRWYRLAALSVNTPDRPLSKELWEVCDFAK